MSNEPNGTTTTAPWQDLLPADFTVDQGGKPVPARELPFVKEAKDLPGFVKTAYDAHREIGARIPVKIAKPEDAVAWRKEHLPKLYQAGILEAPPATPQDYGIAKPEDLPPGLTWSDERAGKLAEVLHKHGVPKSAVPDLLALHTEALGGVQQIAQTSTEEAMTTLHKEFPADFDARFEAAGRLTKAIFKADEVAMLNATGIGNHPAFLGALMRLAPLAESDSSFMREVVQAAGGMTREDARAEYAKVMSDPTHPMHEKWRRRDPEAVAYVQGLYDKIPGGKTPVTIGGGITVTGRPS